MTAADLRRAGSVTAVALLVLAVAAGAVLASDVLLLVFAGILVAVLLRGLAGRLRAHLPFNDGLALTIVAIAIIGMPITAAWLLWPGITEQVRTLSDALPQAYAALRDRVADVAWVQRVLDEIPALLQAAPHANVLGKLSGYFSTTLGAIANLLIIVAVGTYFAVTPGLYLEGLVRLFPHRKRPRIAAVLRETAHTLGWWLAGKFASMAIVGVLTGAGLWLLDVPLAFVLALIASLLTFIPNFGPVLALLPAALLALSQSPTLALYVTLLYAAVQFVETYLITPLLQRRMVSLPPALTLVAQVVAGVMLGALGLVLATPLAVVGMVFVRRFYLEDALGDSQQPMSPD